MLNKNRDSKGLVTNKLIDFRLTQLYRLLREVGWGYLLLAFLVGFGMLMAILTLLYKSQNPAIGLLGAGLALMMHLRRRDLPLLLKLDISLPKLFAAEYLIGFLPLSLLFLFAGNFGALILLNGSLVLISFTKPIGIGSGNFMNRLDFKILPLKFFEARSYLRRFFFSLALVYLLLLVLAKFIAPALLLALLSAMTFAAFFDEIENKDLFEVFHDKKGVLQHKIRIYLGLYYLLNLPSVLLFLGLHPEYWYLLLAALFFGTTIISFNIFYKYAAFTPYRRRVYNSMANSLFIVSILIPFFYPATLVYLIVYLIRARKNIKHYYAENQ